MDVNLSRRQLLFGFIGLALPSFLFANEKGSWCPHPERFIQEMGEKGKAPYLNGIYYDPDGSHHEQWAKEMSKASNVDLEV